MSRPRSQQWVIRGSIAGAAISLVVAACVTNDHPRPTCADLADGGPPAVTPTPGYTYFVEPSTDAQAPEALGMAPDPGPACTNCQQGDDLEIMLVSDFEDGFAPAWINYGEPGAIVEPKAAGAALDADGGTLAGPPQPWYGLQATDLRTTPGGARCNSSYALHLEGGPFLSWGGGYATQWMNVRGASYADQYCSLDTDPSAFGIGTAPMRAGDTCRFWASPVLDQPSLSGLDASAFDGIALWARRGPGGASNLRVALVDINTSESSAKNAELRGEEPACQRLLTCCRQCGALTHVDYDLDTGVLTEDVTDMRCHLEEEPMPPFRKNGDVIEVQRTPNGPWESTAGLDSEEVNSLWRDWDQKYKPCCPATLEEDPKYGGNFPGECAPYVFKFDPSSGSYCQLPGELLPEKNENRCEDGFEASIIVDTEWKLFTIPWAELRRLTIGRPPIDAHSIWTIRVYPTAGWLDTYIDDIGFYRKKQ